ncbi:MAG: sugar ABC transporter permease [Spirochaetaceae bacterium]
MVTTRAKKWSTYAIFVLPALILYTMFAIIPLIMGGWLSTTNWDGVSPWVPVQIPIEQFENEIIPKMSSSQREFVNSYYIKDESQGTYRKQVSSDHNLKGLRKYKMMATFTSAGYVNKNFKFVGLNNYKSVFSAESDPTFWPSKYQVKRFKAGYPLTKASEIEVKDYEKNLLQNISNADDQDIIISLYNKVGDNYVLDMAKFPRKGQKFTIAGELIELPDVGDDWEGFLDMVEEAALNNEKMNLDDIVLKTITSATDGTLSESSDIALRVGAKEVYDSASLKRVLSENWYTNGQRMGVLVFTIFFSFFFVLFSNVIALLIALALDQELKRRNLLRSMFFIPNVLSMVVVAFIWQLVFSHIFPMITGVNRWLSNPDLAPWITIIVASWQAMGFYMIVYLAGLQSVPGEILESAAIDGASGWKKFYYIVMPMLVPAITIALFMSISGSLKTFDIIFALFPSTTRNMGVENITINIYRNAFVDRQAGMATAKAILLMISIGIVTFIQLNYTKKKEVEL